MTRSYLVTLPCGPARRRLPRRHEFRAADLGRGPQRRGANRAEQRGRAMQVDSIKSVLKAPMVLALEAII